jgi:hypothetical protein
MLNVGHKDDDRSDDGDDDDNDDDNDDTMMMMAMMFDCDGDDNSQGDGETDDGDGDVDEDDDDKGDDDDNDDLNGDDDDDDPNGVDDDDDVPACSIHQDYHLAVKGKMEPLPILFQCHMTMSPANGGMICDQQDRIASVLATVKYHCREFRLWRNRWGTVDGKHGRCLDDWFEIEGPIPDNPLLFQQGLEFEGDASSSTSPRTCSTIVRPGNSPNYHKGRRCFIVSLPELLIEEKDATALEIYHGWLDSAVVIAARPYRGRKGANSYARRCNGKGKKGKGKGKGHKGNGK